MSRPLESPVSSNPADGPRSLLGRWADFVYRRRFQVILGWIGVMIVLGAVGPRLAGEWAADYSTPGSESKAAADLLEQRFAGDSGDTIDVVWEAEAGAQSAPVKRRVDNFLAEAGKVAYVGPAGDVQTSRDGTIAVTRLALEGRAWDIPKDSGKAVIALAEKTSGDGLKLAVGGNLIQNSEEQNPPEFAGIVAAMVILLIAFGSLVAVGLPLLVALFGLGVSGLLIGLLAALVAVPDWATAVSNLLGIGVGIDYALLVLTRFRASLSHGNDVHDALVESVTTAGRSVLVAGATVVVAVMGLFIVGAEYMRGVAMATSIAVLVVMFAALTLLPALLAIMGRRVNDLKIPGLGGASLAGSDSERGEGTLAARWSRQVQKRPWTMATAGALVLIALALPSLSMNLGFADASNDPPSLPTYQSYKLIEKGFGAGVNGPFVIALDLDETAGGGRATSAAVAKLSDSLRQTDGVANVQTPVFNAGKNSAVVIVTPDLSPQDERIRPLVDKLRDDVIPASLAGTEIEASLGGPTASFVDQSDFLANRLPVFIAGVVGLSLLLLLLAFRSPLIAIKAGVMNVLSVGAAYGVVSMAANGGWFGQLLGISSPIPIAPFVPVIMFAILFGLSMDYEVFLMSRIREEYLAGKETHDAITAGLAKTARVITAAAAIMVAVFMAFLLSEAVFLRLMGIGMATAVFVDATIVRMVLVPATLQLFGDANWWIPRWLDRRLPRWDVEARPAGAGAE